MGRADRIAHGLLRPINPFACIILGGLTAFWGLWILMPWDVFASAPVFSLMHQLAPEWVWGTWAFLTGSIIIGAIIHGMYRCLYGALALAWWHWWTVSILMWFGDWHNTAGLTYSFIALYCTYLYLNIKMNYKKCGEKIPNFYT